MNDTLYDLLLSFVCNKQTRGKFNYDKLNAGIQLRRSRNINGQTYEREVNYKERYWKDTFQ